MDLFGRFGRGCSRGYAPVTTASFLLFTQRSIARGRLDALLDLTEFVPNHTSDCLDSWQRCTQTATVCCDDGESTCAFICLTALPRRKAPPPRAAKEQDRGPGGVGWMRVRDFATTESADGDDQSSRGSKENGWDLPMMIFLKSGCAGLNR